MHRQPPSPYASDSNYSFSGTSDSSVIGPSGMSINLEELVFTLVGDFQLKFYKHGQLVTCGTMGRTDVGESNSIPESPGYDPLSTKGSASTAQHKEEDLTIMFSSPYEDEHCVGMNASYPYPELQAEPLTNAEPQRVEQAFQVIPQVIPTTDSVPLVPAILSGRTSRRNEDRTRVESARKAFVFSTMPLTLSPQIQPPLHELWKLLSEYSQADCKALAIASVAALHPKRRLTHPYGSEPPGWWPKSVRYLDASHLVFHERQALMFHLWFNPSNSEIDVLNIPEVPSVKGKFRRNDLERIFELVLRIRAVARNNI